jgi:trigger factor
MNIKEIKSESLKKEFEISIPAKDLDGEIEKNLQKIATTVKVDGFRPGKVPVSLVKQRYGSKARQDALEDLLQNATNKIVKDHKLRLALRPKYDVKEQGDGKDFVFTMTAELLPEIAPAKIEDMKLDRYKATVAKKDIDDSLASVAEQFHKTAPIEKARKTKDGDIVVIDFLGKVDGTPFEGGEAKKYKLTLGSKSFIPGFEDQLIGKNAGDDVVVKVTFPKEYTKPLAGKDAEFEVKIHEIHEKKLPDMTDDFAKELGLESMDELRSMVEKNLQREWDNLSRDYAKQDILNLLSDHYKKLDLPQSMVDGEFHSICHRLHHHETKDDKHEHCSGEAFDKKCEGWRKEYYPIAERRVKLGLVLASIANGEGLTVRQKELEDAVMQEASKYRGQEKQVFEYYKNNPEAIEQLKAPILEEKVIDHVLEKAKVTEKPVSFDALKKMIEKRDEEMENAFKE